MIVFKMKMGPEEFDSVAASKIVRLTFEVQQWAARLAEEPERLQGFSYDEEIRMQCELAVWKQTREMVAKDGDVQVAALRLINQILRAAHYPQHSSSPGSNYRGMMVSRAQCEVLEYMGELDTWTPS